MIFILRLSISMMDRDFDKTIPSINIKNNSKYNNNEVKSYLL